MSIISLLSNINSQEQVTNQKLSGQTISDTIVIVTPQKVYNIVLPDIMNIILQKKDIPNLIPIDIPSKRVVYEETEVNKSDKIAFNHLNLSLRLNTLGFGLEAATPLNEQFVLRGGFDLFPISFGNHTYSLRKEFSQLEYAFGYIPQYRGKAKVNFFNGHVLADFYPIKTGIFHITAGVFIGSNKATLDGFLSDPNDNPAKLLPGYEWPVFEYGNHRIDLTGGNLDFDLKLGNVIKPYVGVGLGRAFSKNKFGFKVELGVMYQGDYTLKQNGSEFRFGDIILSDGKDAEDYEKWLKWWPMLNFQLTYRIF